MISPNSDHDRADRVKLIMTRMSGVYVWPSQSFCGVGLCDIINILFVVSLLLVVGMTIISDQLDTLHRVKAAICGGDVNFVYQIDGFGLVNYAYPPRVDLASFEPIVPWRQLGETFDYQGYLLDGLLSGDGLPSTPCTFEECYDVRYGQLFVPLPAGRPSCCAARQLAQPNVTGGYYSLEAKSIQSNDDASTYYNTECTEMMDFNGYITNLMQGAMGMELWKYEREAGITARCGGKCLPEAPICKLTRTPNTSKEHPDFARGGLLEHTTCVTAPDENGDFLSTSCPTYDNGYSCVQPQPCSVDVAPYCSFNSLLGVSARQLCPTTCGCTTPQSPLALFTPDQGCPSRCVESTQYREALANTPCVDIAVDNPNFVGFLDQFATAIRVVPVDFSSAGLLYVDFFTRFGCAYLLMDTVNDALALGVDIQRAGLVNTSTGLAMPPEQPNFFPANIGVGLNPCVKDGFLYPVKPLSFFCPVACGCRAGDNGCPDSCPARFDARNADGQVDYSSREPNPSPRNVPLFPWRYAPEGVTFNNDDHLADCARGNCTPTR